MPPQSPQVSMPGTRQHPPRTGEPNRSPTPTPPEIGHTRSRCSRSPSRWGGSSVGPDPRRRAGRGRPGAIAHCRSRAIPGTASHSDDQLPGTQRLWDTPGSREAARGVALRMSHDADGRSPSDTTLGALPPREAAMVSASDSDQPAASMTPNALLAARRRAAFVPDRQRRDGAGRLVAEPYVRDGLHPRVGVAPRARGRLAAAPSGLWVQRARDELTAVIGAFAAAIKPLRPVALGPNLIGPLGLDGRRPVHRPPPTPTPADVSPVP